MIKSPAVPMNRSTIRSSGARSMLDGATASATATDTSSSREMEVKSTNHARSARARPTSVASVVLPTPPRPVSVTVRLLRNRRSTDLTSSALPIVCVRGSGSNCLGSGVGVVDSDGSWRRMRSSISLNCGPGSSPASARAATARWNVRRASACLPSPYSACISSPQSGSRNGSTDTRSSSSRAASVNR